MQLPVIEVLTQRHYHPTSAHDNLEDTQLTAYYKLYSYAKK